MNCLSTLRNHGKMYMPVKKDAKFLSSVLSTSNFADKLYPIVAESDLDKDTEMHPE
jgi:hypothetical protein